TLMDYENAPASFELLSRRLHESYRSPYLLTPIEKPDGRSFAVVNLEPHLDSDETTFANRHELQSQNPEAMFEELKDKIVIQLPQLLTVQLSMAQSSKINGATKVIVTASDGEKTWTTAGVDSNPVKAGWNA